MLSASGRNDVQAAVDKLYNDKRIRLWVVYVNDFSGQSRLELGAKHHECTAISATTMRCWRSPPRTARIAFDVPNAVTGGTST